MSQIIQPTRKKAVNEAIKELEQQLSATKLKAFSTTNIEAFCDCNKKVKALIVMVKYKYQLYHKTAIICTCSNGS